MNRSFLFLLGSARQGGNTETLARAAAEQLPAGAEQRWLDLARLPLADFVDARHSGEAWPEPRDPEAGNEAALRDATLAATDIVLATPLYWYSVSSSTKAYLDHWTKWLNVPGLDFRERMAGRTLWGVAAMGDRAEGVAQPLDLMLGNTAAYMKMRYGGVLLGNGSGPGQVLDDTRAVARAKTFFARRAPLARSTGE
ncbi:flavodoxin family protein [Streptomyces abyssomicinicus]|uniref:flavodoxin family protein n=1 Tax=Streptomyces abyssomicinicus TaxID=574929 RepID=UPI00124FD349|nr:NAD(P)H-dependent oxidoreductase [Streptomyces abyssomicinicus]